MPRISGSVYDVGLNGSRGTLWISAGFRTGSLGVIAPRRVPYAIVDGQLSDNVVVEPGPAVIEIDVGVDARDSWPVVIPDADVSLLDLIAEAYEWDPVELSAFAQLRADAEAAAEAARLDRVRTGLDRTATGQDRTQTGLDRVATGEDRTATGEDRTQTGLDRTATGQDRDKTREDREQTRLDRVATGQDRTQTGLDRVAAAESASAAETAANEFGLTVTSSQVGPEVPSTATLSGDGPAYAIHLALSKGLQGDQGDPGEVTTATLNTALAGKADLTGGQVPTSQLPAIALTKPFPVADRAAMLALAAQEGDVAVITGGADKGTYMLGDGPSGTFGSWVKLTVPDAPVQSVNGQTGTVNLSASDVGASPTGHKHAVPADLITTGTPLSTTFLNGVGAWQTPPDTNTTYAVPTQAEAEAGSATTARAFSAQRVRQAADAAIAAREWDGTQAQYDALPTKNPLVTYYVTDA